MPRLPKGKKRPSDDDPFWDSWDEEPIAKGDRDSLWCTNKNKSSLMKNAAAAAAAAYNPFGRDGFGDSWDYKPSTKFASNDDPVPLEDFSTEANWGTCRQRQETKRREEMKRKKEREYRLSWLKKEREAAAKAAAVAAEAEAAAAKTAAEEKWQIKVKQATDCIALADPAQALTILYSLSLDVDITKYIDQKKKREVGQLYAAICDRQQLNGNCSVDQSSSEINKSTSENNESASDECTIGDDTVEANLSSKIEDEDSSEIQTGKATIVVDRLPTHDARSETNENDSDESTIGGDTIKIN